MKRTEFRVWRKSNNKYRGFVEVEALTPQEAIKAVQDFDWSIGDITLYDYEVQDITNENVETGD